MPGTVSVSNRDFNQFVFPAPIAKGPIFSAGTPLLGKPVYLDDNTQVLVQFASGSDKPFDMIVELSNGAVDKLWLKPEPIPGITHRVGDAGGPVAPWHASAPGQSPASSSARGSDVQLLKQFVMGFVPEGFESEDLPKLTRFDKFSVVPMAAWSDQSSRRVLKYSLVATPGQTAVVSEPEFFHPGVIAVLVNGDVVNAQHSPTLFVVEEYHPNE
ncbi:MAG: hypothetical protein RB191_05570 [Terriglobia bacterium]|nr:hypothetical protein [Terriglobia bacterium]